MRLAIVGSRTFNDYALLEKAVESNFNIAEIDTIISGGATGADKLGELWAKNHGKPVVQHLPNWDEGRQAGFIRNLAIVKDADNILALHCAGSKGTQNTIDLSAREGKPCVVIKVAPRKLVRLNCE